MHMNAGTRRGQGPQILLEVELQILGCLEIVFLIEFWSLVEVVALVEKAKEIMDLVALVEFLEQLEVMELVDVVIVGHMVVVAVLEYMLL